MIYKGNKWLKPTVKKEEIRLTRTTKTPNKNQYHLKLSILFVLLYIIQTASSEGVFLQDGNDYLEEDYQLIQPDPEAPPVGYQYSKTIHEEHHQRLLGCLYSDNLCDHDEVCYNDNLFGRCISPSDEGEYDSIDELSLANTDLVVEEIKRLDLLNLDWGHDYTQCVLHSLLATIQHGLQYDIYLCDLVKGSDISDEEIEEEFNTLVENSMLPSIEDEDEEYQQQPEDEVLLVAKRKLLEEDDDEHKGTFSVRQEDDGGILIEPDQAVTLYNNDLEYPDYYDTFENDDKDVSANNYPMIWFSEDDNQDPQLSYNKNYQDDQNGIFLDPVQQESSKDYWPSYDKEGDDIIFRTRRGFMDDLEQPGNDGDEVYQVPVYNGDSNFLTRHKFDIDPPYPAMYEDEESEDLQPFEYYNDEVDSYLPRNEDRYRSSIGSEDGPFIFNRNERLDVKKPGPYAPSDESLFLKAFMDQQSLSNQPQYILGNPFGPRSNDSDNEKGQMEYEMPLLAPAKEKRILPMNLFSLEPMPKEEFVHLAVKNRFNTWNQGSKLIDGLAKNYGLPMGALTNRKVEDHHVQFKVEPNPQEIDAKTMVESLISDKDLQKRISNTIGVDVENASAGDRDNYAKTLFSSKAGFIGPKGLAIIIASAFGAAILAFAALFIIKRRAFCSRQQNLKCVDPLDEERGKVQEEYKQLCRDWSRSSRGQKESSPTKPSSTTIQRVQSQDSKNSDKSSTGSWGEEPTSTNMDISTGHMVLAYMEDHLKNKQRLEQEWVGLCSYEAEPCATTVAFKAENKKKNRYPDKLPYDHNRVILNAVLNASNSDYINASTVSDHDPRNPSYIVTQGPLGQSVADFWQMIWEQGCVVIVMLSRLQDNGLQLCHRYWPEEGSEQYHIFEVHLVSEHVWCEDYLVRSVYLKNTRTGETRTVTQFHFRSWPAQSVPSSTKALLEFRRKVNKSYRGRSCPIAIHCSDGVGRTGTYVLIDMVLNRMAKGCKEIDIAATLEHIRDQRSGMVQTKPQFEFCLMAVAEEVHAILKALLP